MARIITSYDLSSLRPRNEYREIRCNVRKRRKKIRYGAVSLHALRYVGDGGNTTRSVDMKHAHPLMQFLPSLAAGIFIGAAIFDALPHSASMFGWQETVILALIGAALWWMQKIILDLLKKPSLPPLIATALWLHSAIEGFVTGIAFGISDTAGFLVLTGMVLHLLPEFFAAVALMKDAGAKNQTSVIVTFVGYAVLFISFLITHDNLFTWRIFMPTLIAISGGAFLFVGVNVLRKHLSAAHLAVALLGAAIAFFTA
jgi:zinc transporter ZupT